MTIQPSRPGFVYFAMDEANGLIKIGRSRNVAKRMQQLRWQTKHPIQLLTSTHGGPAAEMALHDLFFWDRDHGEWFRPSPGMVAVIDAVSRISLTSMSFQISMFLRKIRDSSSHYWGEWAGLL